MKYRTYKLRRNAEKRAEQLRKQFPSETFTVLCCGFKWAVAIGFKTGQIGQKVTYCA